MFGSSSLLQNSPIWYNKETSSPRRGPSASMLCSASAMRPARTNPSDSTTIRCTSRIHWFSSRPWPDTRTRWHFRGSNVFLCRLLDCRFDIIVFRQFRNCIVFGSSGASDSSGNSGTVSSTGRSGTCGSSSSISSGMSGIVSSLEGVRGLHRSQEVLGWRSGQGQQFL